MSSLSDSDYKAIVRRAILAFRDLPGVHTVGIGGRERGGKPTGELVLKVFVSQKLPKSELAANQVVADTFEGISTDVVEAPSPRPAAAVAGATLGGPYSEDTGRYRPLRGGIQLAGEHCYGRGTLGFLARIDEPAPQRIVALTAHHALFSSVNAEDPALRVGQPTGDDSVTKCCSGIFGKFLKGYREDTMDAAIVKLDPKTEYYPQIEEIGVVAGHHEVTEAEAATLTYPVRKRGRTTGLTGGTIQAIGASYVTFTPSNFMVIKPNPPTPAGNPTFADRGDSGAAVVNDSNEIVGMLFDVGSLTANKFLSGWGFAWAIQDITSRFNTDGIDLLVEAGTTLNEKRVVLVTPFDTPETASAVAADEPTHLISQVEADLSASDVGRLLITLWMRHSLELNQLVNTNRRIAARWHRQGGAELLQCALRSAYNHRISIPIDICGRSTDDCVHEILNLFDQYGSRRLKEDIRNYRGLVPSVGGRFYGEIVAQLGSSPERGAQWLQ